MDIEVFSAQWLVPPRNAPRLRTTEQPHSGERYQPLGTGGFHSWSVTPLSLILPHLLTRCLGWQSTLSLNVSSGPLTSDQTHSPSPSLRALPPALLKPTAQVPPWQGNVEKPLESQARDVGGPSAPLGSSRLQPRPMSPYWELPLDTPFSSPAVSPQ